MTTPAPLERREAAARDGYSCDRCALKFDNGDIMIVVPLLQPPIGLFAARPDAPVALRLCRWCCAAINNLARKPVFPRDPR